MEIGVSRARDASFQATAAFSRIAREPPFRVGGHSQPQPRPQPATSVSYTHLRAHETRSNLVCRLLLEKKWPRNQRNSLKSRCFASTRRKFVKIEQKKEKRKNIKNERLAQARRQVVVFVFGRVNSASRPKWSFGVGETQNFE